MALALQSLHPQVNSDLTWDSRYPQGDKTIVTPSSLGLNSTAFSAAAITLTNLQQNVSVFYNYRAFLTGTSAATATLSVNAISGGLGGFAIAGSNLTNSAATAASGQIQVVATDGVTTVNFPVQPYTIVASATRQKIKSNFGLYIYLDRNMGTSQKLSRMGYFSQFPFVKGFQDIVFPAKLENPALVGGAAQFDGSWNASGDSGFAYVNKMLSTCAAMNPPRHYMLQDSTYGFASPSGPGSVSSSFPSGFMPSYFAGGTYGANTPTVDGVHGGVWQNSYATAPTSVAYFVRYWVPAVMDRYLAKIAAYGAQYDSHPLFEMASFLSESAMPSVGGYSDPLQITQLLRMFPAGRTAFPTTQLRYWGNYEQQASSYKTIIDACVQNFWALGGADCINETDPTGAGKLRVIPFDQAYRGINPSTHLPDLSYTNYVGKAVWVAEFEPDEEMPRSGAAGAAASGNNNWTDYVRHANDQGAQYVTLFDNTFGGNNDKRTVTSPSGLHPDAMDFWSSVLTANGGNVNGAVANITMPFIPPSLWPTGS